MIDCVKPFNDIGANITRRSQTSDDSDKNYHTEAIVVGMGTGGGAATPQKITRGASNTHCSPTFCYLHLKVTWQTVKIPIAKSHILNLIVLIVFHQFLLPQPQNCSHANGNSFITEMPAVIHKSIATYQRHFNTIHELDPLGLPAILPHFHYSSQQND